MQLWKPAGRLDCIDLGEDFFLLKFGLIEDYDTALKGGPWFIGEHYLTIRAWEPYFKPNATACSKVAVWARLPCLPIEFYDMGVLKEIGNAIGPVLRIDATTASGTRGRYARICVQVDLAKPLVRRVFIGRFGQEVLYKGISSLCFACGRLGHRREVCPYLISKVTESQPESGEPVVRLDDMANPISVQSVEAGNIKDEYAPWMLVDRRKQGPRQGSHRPNHVKPSVAHASAFKAQDLGHHIRSRPAIIPPSNPPNYSLEGKRKSVGLDTSSSAILPSPLKLDRNIFHTTSASGVVLSSPSTKQNQFSYKAKNGTKGKGKGKQQQQAQVEHKSAAIGNKNQRENHELSPSTLEQIRSSPTMIRGWFDPNIMEAWSHIFPLTHKSKKKGFLHLVDPAWLEWENPWWRFPTDIPSREEGRILGWRALSLNSLKRILPKSNLLEEVQLKKMVGTSISAISLMGCLKAITLVQLCGESIHSSLLIMSREVLMGILEHAVCLSKTEGLVKNIMRNLSWKLLNQARNQLQVAKDSLSFPPVLMNIIC